MVGQSVLGERHYTTVRPTGAFLRLHVGAGTPAFTPQTLSCDGLWLL